MEANLIGISCGRNPVVLGSVVNGDTQISGEIVTVFSGDIIFGNLNRLDVHKESDIFRLSDLYEQYKNSIPPNGCLYVVVTDGLSGTIYVCGHIRQGVWSVFAKTAGYA